MAHITIGHNWTLSSCLPLEVLSHEKAGRQRMPPSKAFPTRPFLRACFGHTWSQSNLRP